MARFIVSYSFRARTSDIIEASSKEEAEAAINAKIERDDFELEADDIDDVDFSVLEMHPVTRDGREIWTTRPINGDLRGHPSALLATPLFGDAA